MKRDRDWDNCCEKRVRYREKPMWETNLRLDRRKQGSIYRTRGIHCFSSFKGRVNGWARLRRPGRLVRIGGKSGRRTWYELLLVNKCFFIYPTCSNQRIALQIQPTLKQNSFHSPMQLPLSKNIILSSTCSFHFKLGAHAAWWFCFQWWLENTGLN